MKRIGGMLFLFGLLFFLSSYFVFAQENASIVFNGTISELNLTAGTNNNVVELKNYFSYNESFTVDFKYQVGSDGISGLVIEIDSSGKVNVEANENGIRSVFFVADDDIEAVKSNEVKIIVVGASEPAVSFSPNTETVQLIEGEEQTFAAAGGSGNDTIEWYLDGSKLNFSESSYLFSNSSVGVHTLRVVSAGESKTWTVSVLAEEIVNPITPPPEPEPEITGPVCGNSRRETGEDCSNCPADVSCSINSECLNGECVPKKSFDFSKIIIWLVLFAATVVVVVAGVIIIKKRKANTKSDSTKSESVSDEDENFIEKLKHIFKKKKLGLDSEESKESSGIKLKDSIETQIESQGQMNPSLKPLMDYFKANSSKYKKEDLVKQVLNQGWKKEQVDEVLSEIEKNKESKGVSGNDDAKTN